MRKVIICALEGAYRRLVNLCTAQKSTLGKRGWRCIMNARSSSRALCHGTYAYVIQSSTNQLSSCGG